MKISDLSIRRPVFATVINLVIVLDRRHLLSAPVGARISAHRRSGGHGGDNLPRRQRRDHRIADHPAARGFPVGHRGHRFHDLDQPLRAQPDHHHLQAHARHRGGRQRRARPRGPGARPAARRDRRADHLQGRGRRAADHLSRLRQRPAVAPRGHRFRRPLCARPAADPDRRRRRAHLRRAALRHAGLARCRQARRLQPAAERRGERADPSEHRDSRRAHRRRRRASSRW